MSPLGITLLMMAAFAGFGWLAWRKLGIVAALQPEMRWDRPWGRLCRVVRNGLLQSRMIRGEWKPGVMHAAIFLGFLALLARKLQLIVVGYDEPFVYPGVLGAAFAFGKDVVEVAVLVAVAYAFFRRLVQKPARLERNREALLILSLIAVIMVTDFLFDGFRFALAAATDPGIAHEARFAVIGGALGRAFAGFPPSVLTAGYRFTYWAQMATVFAFLVLLPVGEHFHIVTALPALFFARGEPANRVPGVDLDRMMDSADGDDMKVGVRTAADLVWKDGLDAFTCTECGRCKDSCPTFLTGKPLALKWIFDGLKAHLLAQRAALVTHNPEGMPPLVPEVIGADTLWSCTTCGYCESACPIELEHLPRFYRLRQHQVMMEGAFPHELKAVFEAYEAQSNPWGLPADARGEWARGLDVPVVSTAEEVAALDWLYYVGSAESFDPRGQKIAAAFVKVMRAAGVRIGILGRAETSTGESVRRAGNEMLFQALAKALVETLNGLCVTRIVTCDPHAFNTLANEYPDFGGRYEVIHHAQLIAQLIAEGRLPLSPRHRDVIFHDPCYLGRHNGEYEAPRRVLAAACLDEPLEFERSRDKAMCCGAGGARMWMEETIGRRINVLRVEQALARGPAIIATACPYCAVMMGDGIAALGREGDLAARDIAELVAESLAPPPATS
ncbi:MAG TPA: (Fe-S)-binding protein [Casimicrobiaceae bacterium]|nr:(Fe-S)-binding protein [Casimicrobiaceae bacterium]